MRLIVLMAAVLSILFSANFTSNGDGTVTDNRSGLMWQDDHDAKTVKKNWSDAVGYCENLTLANYTDWRLPSYNELFFIADRNRRDPAIESVFQNIVSWYYWSSTTITGYENHAWYVHFLNGRGYWNVKSYKNFVRCVRSGIQKHRH